MHLYFVHRAAYAASLFPGIAVLAHRYVQIREGGGQPSPLVPLGGTSLFCEDGLRPNDPAGTLRTRMRTCGQLYATGYPEHSLHSP